VARHAPARGWSARGAISRFPGSPPINTTAPSPAFTCSQRRINSAISSSGPAVIPRRGCNWPPAIWRGFASSIRTWQYRSANSTRLRPTNRPRRQSAGGVASKRRAYPGPRRRGHSPTTRLRSRKIARRRGPIWTSDGRSPRRASCRAGIPACPRPGPGQDVAEAEAVAQA